MSRPLYVVLLVRGSRVDYSVNVGLGEGELATQLQQATARKAATAAHPNAEVLGVY